MHDRIADQLNKILMGTDTLPKWPVVPERTQERNAVENYRAENMPSTDVETDEKNHS